jgi:trehalose 6-phosphate phosphatase
VTPVELNNKPPERLLDPMRARPQSAAVMCDVDGTLAPIVAEPQSAVVPDVARTLLADLSRRYALVGCVSGRRAEEARRMVGVESLMFIGNHGFEVLRPGAAAAETASVVDAAAERVRRFAESSYSGKLADIGILLEDKHSIYSFHWREAADEKSARSELARVAAAAEESGLAPHWGRKVLEIRPPVGIDKGTALESVLREANVTCALYGGDDTTDVDAFRSLRALLREGTLSHAICVGVRSDEGPEQISTAADLVVDGPAGFLDVLTMLLFQDD